ncbi:MAG: cobalt-precorrin 5A hydrolase [Mogibacterium sp.]|nr:cobalt-precorrin 5A hydrolase [Mogibacterium sp.]
MQIRIVSFTIQGARLGLRLQEQLPELKISVLYFGKTEPSEPEVNRLIRPQESASALCGQWFRDREAVVFIGAAGIAVRTIAPFVRDKLQDPPVLVLEETGRFVIPILSGHVGGANELALEIAEALGAVPVLTTATDLQGAFAVDLFAKENGLHIVNREGIAAVSAKALTGRPVTLSIREYPPEEPVDVIVSDDPSMQERCTIRLCPKAYAVGIGCRKGKSFEELRAFTLAALAEAGISEEEIGAVASVDRKAEEPGLKALAAYWRVPFLTFEPAMLAKAQGTFSGSEFVQEQVGVDNVCERAAVLAAGSGAELILTKRAGQGITVAVARCRKAGKDK